MKANEIQIGNTPWSPHNVEQSSVTILNEGDFPLAGYYSIGDDTYGFLCLDGENNDDNTWVYGEIDQEIENKIKSSDFSTIREFVQYLSDKFKSTPLVASSINYQISKISPINRSKLARNLNKRETYPQQEFEPFI